MSDFLAKAKAKKVVYEAKDMLNSKDAVMYLMALIDAPLSTQDFIDIGRNHELKSYVYLDGDALDIPNICFLYGIHFYEACVDYDMAYIHEINARVDAIYYDVLAVFIEGGLVGINRLAGDNQELYFKSTDIKALADKINSGAALPNQDEITELKQRITELEQENAELKARPESPKPTLLMALARMFEIYKEQELGSSQDDFLNDLSVNEALFSKSSLNNHFKSAKQALEEKRKRLENPY